ncbi:DUF3180 domain-containing protein [Geodermatophilus sabuli]|uniref:DUF3180 domain-containing protein n=1 Tax=Geodermatophilus sabuli TaxID=1564158 RepID=A0A285EF85_9ACTN|nr:DUF3180 domain-containing protein [Geodermatophilus sabuli]MBB3083415.1 hypothetical protein [Geodermatophilus sabuli]SNX96864.1 Protein of unknown function [Geodermatophilus sabuli]
MRPVSRRDLGVLATGLAVAVWLVVRASYGSLPELRWWLPVPLGVLAVAEWMGARTLRARLAALRDRRPPAERGSAPPVRPVEPMLVARAAVLAQASAYVGAAFVGIWLGVLAHVAPAVSRLQAASGDTVTGVVGVVCAAALVGAALWLESVCRIPPSASDDEPPAAARG